VVQGSVASLYEHRKGLDGKCSTPVVDLRIAINESGRLATWIFREEN